MKVTVSSTIEISFAGHRIQLRGDGSAFLVDEEALLVADLHLGKDTSFRFAGVPVPAGVNASTLELLAASIETSKVKKVIVLGDLIHDGNSMTPELVRQVAEFRTAHQSLEFILVRGNHDRYVDAFPDSWNLQAVPSIQLESLMLVHETEINSRLSSDTFQIGGHWHPVVSVGRGADAMRLPCFMITDKSLTLPAFGAFKGGMKQAKTKGRSFYPICDGKVWLDQPLK